MAHTPTALWLRTTTEFPSSKAAQRLLASLPATARYHPSPGQRLRRTDRVLSEESLPELDWIPIREAFVPEPPPTSWPAATPERVPLRLVPSESETEPHAALLEWERFRDYALRAPQVRLDRLRFALSDTDSALVIGSPLPPLPGIRFSLHAGVAIPAGFTWSPRVAPEVLARCIQPPQNGLALWTPDGHIARIHPEQILPITRSTIRTHRPLTTDHQQRTTDH